MVDITWYNYGRWVVFNQLTTGGTILWSSILFLRLFVVFVRGSGLGVSSSRNITMQRIDLNADPFLRKQPWISIATSVCCRITQKLEIMDIYIYGCPWWETPTAYCISFCSLNLHHPALTPTGRVASWCGKLYDKPEMGGSMGVSK